MKKCIYLLGLLCLMLFSCKESEKPVMTVDQVNEAWQTVPIKKVKTADVMGMVQAFQKQWPTQSVAALLKDLALPEDQQQYISEYDQTHGFMSFAEGSDDKDAESMEARVWKRSNGHQLFGITFFQPSAKVKSFVAFYDYDPSSKALTPALDVFTPYEDAYLNKEVGYSFYPEPEEMVANEYFFNWWGALRHVYTWDGMNFKGPEMEFEGISTLLTKYNEDYINYNNEPFAKYALFDIDEDGEPELILSTESEECQMVASVVEGDIQLLAGMDYKRHLMFYKGVIGDAGGCGTGCYYAYYVKLQKSAPEYSFGDMQIFNFETEQMDDEYNKDGEPLTQEEGEAILESFGESYDPVFEWRPLR